MEVLLRREGSLQLEFWGMAISKTFRKHADCAAEISVTQDRLNAASSLDPPPR